jgi:hypothetical protein
MTTAGPAEPHGAWPGRRSWWLAVLVCLLLAAGSAPLVTGDSIKGDATQNLRIAYNLFHHGTFALSAPGTPGATDAPTSFREPVPPAFVAAYLRLVLPADATDFESWHYGPYTRLIKLGNLAWVFAGLLGFWALSVRLLRQPVWVALAMVLGYTYFFHNPNTVNSLYTELHAGVLLVGSCALLLLALDSRRTPHAVLAGVVMGLLCLTKSVFQGAVPLVVLALFLICRPADAQRWPRWVDLRLPATLLLAFALVVTPWIVRNKVQMDSTEVSAGRSGYVMFKRSLMDQMNPVEYRLAFTLYGPDAYQQWVSGGPLALDLPGDVLRGGRMQRLNPYRSDFQEEDNRSIAQGRPDRSLTFYRQPAALYQQIRMMLADARVRHPELVADEIMQRQALRTMLSDPMRHFKVSALIFWRGFWWAPHRIPGPLPGTPDLAMGFNQWINLGAGLGLLVVLAMGLLRRNAAWLAISALPAAMMVLHANLTHGLPRFTVPAIPLMLLCLVLLPMQLWTRLTSLRPTPSKP